MTGALGDAEPLCNTDNQRPLQAPSASLAISAAISFASFAQLVLVEAGLSQFGARISSNWSLAGLRVQSQRIGKRPRPELQKEQLPLRRRTHIFAFLATFLILQLVCADQ